MMEMKLICELNDKIILGQDGRSEKAPRFDGSCDYKESERTVYQYND